MNPVVKPKEFAFKLRCNSCGVTQDAACDCGVGYSPAREYAAAAVAKPENAKKTNVALAEELGVSDQTVGRARKAVSTNVETETRTGKDGKQYKSRKPRKPKLTLVSSDEMPSEEEAEESYQATLYDQAFLLLESMAETTRRKYFAKLKKEYRDEIDSAKAGVKGFALDVLPTREYLETAIEANGFCHPKKCWHYVAINALLDQITPCGERHNVRVDAGHVRINYRGWRYIADTPRHVKRSLMLFDRKRYEEVHIRQYKLRFRRLTKIVKVEVSRERQDQINAARKTRIADGRKDKTYDLKKRVEGFSGLV